MRYPRHGFTLIELLVVVAIIMMLLSILMPSMRKAVILAERTRCLTNQRSITQALIGYASDHFGIFPPYQLPGVSGFGDAYGLRHDLTPYSGPAASPRPAFNVGLAVTAGHLPVGSLPNVLHCPSFNNSGMGGASAGHCMDGIAPSWKGGSSWEALPNWRILSTYNYRGPSYQRNHANAPPSLKAAASGFVMMIDTPDTRFRGWQSAYNAHGGYNYVTMDLSGKHLADPTHQLDAVVAFYQAAGQRGTVDGRGGGGGLGNGKLDEEIYDMLEAKP